MGNSSSRPGLELPENSAPTVGFRVTSPLSVSET